MKHLDNEIQGIKNDITMRALYGKSYKGTGKESDLLPLYNIQQKYTCEVMIGVPELTMNRNIIDWVNNNLGKMGDDVRAHRMDDSASVYYYFMNEADAVAFKLRWG